MPLEDLQTRNTKREKLPHAISINCHAWHPSQNLAFHFDLRKGLTEQKIESEVGGLGAKELASVVVGAL